MSAFIERSRGLFDSIGNRLQGVNLRQNGIFLALIALVVFFAATTPNAASITPTNFSNLVVQNGYILVLAIGMVMVIIAGHIDLSVGSVAAFIGEPVQGAGGVIIPPATYWPEIQRICDKYGILLIADEVITGFGRTGNMFGSTTFGIRPHIMTIAKGLSSGYQPIGGSIIHDEVFKVVAEGGELYHGYTYSGHPVAAAVALENLRIIQEEGIIDHVRNVAHPYLKAKWDALTEHPMVGEAKLVGLMGSIALTPNKATRAKFKAEAGTVGFKVRERCFANNIIMRHVGDRMIIAPPLVIKPAEIDILMERATKSLDEAYKIVKDEGLFVAG